MPLGPKAAWTVATWGSTGLAGGNLRRCFRISGMNEVCHRLDGARMPPNRGTRAQIDSLDQVERILSPEIGE